MQTEPSKTYVLAVPNLASQSQHDIARTMLELTRFLLDKNRRYGDSALEPVRVHSRADPLEQIRVRADDKLSRLAASEADEDEDVLKDYIGYMVLLYIAQRRKNDERTLRKLEPQRYETATDALGRGTQEDKKSPAGSI